MYQGNNPKALLSVELLTEGLLTLMEQKAYSDISVKELCKCADVSRQTFYKLFKTIDELLEAKIDSVFNKIIKEICKDFSLDVMTMNTIFIQIFCDNKRLTDLIIKNNLEITLINRFMLAVSDFSSIVSLDVNSTYKDYYFAYFTGGLSNIFFHWCRSQNRISSKELTDLICTLIKNNESVERKEQKK